MIIARVPFPLADPSKSRIASMEIDLAVGARPVAVHFAPPAPGRMRLVGFDPAAPLLLFFELDETERRTETRRFIRLPDQAPYRADAGGIYVGTALNYVTDGALEIVHVFEVPERVIVAPVAPN